MVGRSRVHEFHFRILIAVPVPGGLTLVEMCDEVRIRPATPKSEAML